MQEGGEELRDFNDGEGPAVAGLQEAARSNTDLEQAWQDFAGVFVRSGTNLMARSSAAWTDLTEELGEQEWKSVGLVAKHKEKLAEACRKATNRKLTEGENAAGLAEALTLATESKALRYAADAITWLGAKLANGLTRCWKAIKAAWNVQDKERWQLLKTAGMLLWKAGASLFKQAGISISRNYKLAKTKSVRSKKFRKAVQSAAIGLAEYSGLAPVKLIIEKEEQSVVRKVERGLEIEQIHRNSDANAVSKGVMTTAEQERRAMERQLESSKALVQAATAARDKLSGLDIKEHQEEYKNRNSALSYMQGKVADNTQSLNAAREHLILLREEKDLARYPDKNSEDLAIVRSELTYLRAGKQPLARPDDKKRPSYIAAAQAQAKSEKLDKQKPKEKGLEKD